MRKFPIAAGLAATVLLSAGSGLADSYHHYHHYRRDYRACEAGRRRDATTGTIAGGVIGAVAGNALGGGHLGGTLIGGGVGAVAGHQIAKNNHRC
jgi:hypothetical protein